MAARLAARWVRLSRTWCVAECGWGVVWAYLGRRSVHECREGPIWRGVALGYAGLRSAHEGGLPRASSRQELGYLGALGSSLCRLAETKAGMVRSWREDGGRQ